MASSLLYSSSAAWQSGRREKTEERRKKEEEHERVIEEARRLQPLAAEVDTAAKNGDIALVKQLQQLETNSNAIIISVTSSFSLNHYKTE